MFVVCVCALPSIDLYAVMQRLLAKCVCVCMYIVSVCAEMMLDAAFIRANISCKFSSLRCFARHSPCLTGFDTLTFSLSDASFLIPVHDILSLSRPVCRRCAATLFSACVIFWICQLWLPFCIFFVIMFVAFVCAHLYSALAYCARYCSSVCVCPCTVSACVRITQVVAFFRAFTCCRFSLLRCFAWCHPCRRYQNSSSFFSDARSPSPFFH